MLRRFLFAAIVLQSASFVYANESLDARFVFPGQEAAAADARDREAALLDDAADGKLDAHSLLEAALAAGGVADSRVAETYVRRFEHWTTELAVSGRVVGTERDKARELLEYLHDRVLTGGFRETSTSPAEAFEHGRFNCISSLILYLCLADQFGLTAHGVEVPGHVFAIVEGRDGPVVVQTTCRQWFSADGDDEARRSVLRQTIGAAAADRANGRERPLTTAGLLAVVYYNRGIDELEAGRYDAALAANQTALRLDSANLAARANLLATINNWSLELSRRGDLAQAVGLLESGLSAAPDYALFHENLVALHQQRLAAFAAADDSAAAMHALRACYARWQAALEGRGQAAAAADVARRAAGDPFLQPGR